MDKPKYPPRGYNPLRHAAMPYVDKPYKTLLDLICEKNGTKKKSQLEAIIKDAALTEGIS